jgi:hypothetical protein
MRREFELSGDSLSRLLYASQLAALLLALLVVAFPLDSVASVLLAILFASLVLTTAVGLWRKQTGRTSGTHFGPEDITYDPFADPGQAAKDRWKKTVRRLPGGDDEQD